MHYKTIYLPDNVGVILSVTLITEHSSYVTVLRNMILKHNICFRFYGLINPMGVMSSAASLPNRTITGQAYSSKRLTSIVYILSPETNNFPS